MIRKTALRNPGVWAGVSAAAIMIACALAHPALAQSAQTGGACAVSANAAQPWFDKTLTPRCRAKAVVDSFPSLEEKVAALTAGGPGPGRAPKWLTDRGLIQGGGGDGPSGIRGPYGVTAFPAPLTVAASFDPKIAARYGDILGEEVFAWGNSSIIGPAMDITRTWHFGRSVESYGEDPFLAASMSGPEVAALQSHHVMAMIKHFAVYTQEQGRAGDAPQGQEPSVNEIVSERVVREIYLPAFHAAVKAGAANVMCAFPRINGVYACENPLTLGILKQEWGFDGAVSPDYPDGQRSIVAAFNAGLDNGTTIGIAKGQLGATPDRDVSFNGESFKAAVSAGKISPARIDDLLMRHLIPAFRLGVFDNPPHRVAEDVSTPARRAAAADIVAAGTVLLKNKNGVLPFGPNVKTVALIGAQAGSNPVVTEMGSANVRVTHLTPVLTAVRERATGDVKVLYAQGTLGLEPPPLLPTSYVKSPEGLAGFRAEYFGNVNLDFSGKPFTSRLEPTINNATPQADFPTPYKAWSARWNGTFTAPVSGVQKFALTGSGTARLFIDDKLIGEFANDDMGDMVFANVPMQAGASIRLRVEWTPRVTLRETVVENWGNVYGPVVQLGWAPPDDLIAQAAETAKQADVAVVFVGQKVGEGMDRTHLHLDNDQDALIEAVVAANPNTVVVLNTGGAVTMPWLDKVAGVMQMWLPGDAQGPAAAKLLFGDVDPGGRLPVTFPRDETQGPATKSSQYPGDLSAKGAVDVAHFDEGLLVGYRYWDKYKQQPLFPFGYGLSYTQFKTQGFSVQKTAGGGAEVHLTVANVGARAGSQVVQVYLGFPTSAGEPPRQLKAVGKVTLASGQAAPLAIKLAPEAFQYWDNGKKAWAKATGAYTVFVGSSSRDIDYQAKLTVN